MSFFAPKRETSDRHFGDADWRAPEGCCSSNGRNYRHPFYVRYIIRKWVSSVKFCGGFRMRSWPRGGYWFFAEYAAVAQHAGSQRENTHRASRLAKKIAFQIQISISASPFWVYNKFCLEIAWFKCARKPLGVYIRKCFIVISFYMSVAPFSSVL